VECRPRAQTAMDGPGRCAHSYGTDAPCCCAPDRAVMLADTNQRARRLICARICARDAAGHAETGGDEKAWDDFIPSVCRGQRGDRRLSRRRMSLTYVVWLITQRRLATPRRAGTWPERGATASRNPASGALRVACCLPAHALPAPIARIIALTAPTTLGLCGTPFHEPFHGNGAADSGGLDRCDRRSPGSDAGVGRRGGSRLTGADVQRVRMPAVTHCVWRSTRYPPLSQAHFWVSSP
jgi:hypothetical protein